MSNKIEPEQAQLKMVLVFAFNTSMSRFIAIKNNRGYAAGKFNGLGGTIEVNESPESAAIREVKEEAGLQLGEADLVFVGTQSGLTIKATEYTIWIYAARLQNLVFNAHLKGDGLEGFVASINVGSIYHIQSVMRDLQWIIPMSVHAILDSLHPNSTPRVHHVRVS